MRAWQKGAGCSVSYQIVPNFPLHRLNDRFKVPRTENMVLEVLTGDVNPGRPAYHGGTDLPGSKVQVALWPFCSRCTELPGTEPCTNDNRMQVTGDRPGWCGVSGVDDSKRLRPLCLLVLAEISTRWYRAVVNTIPWQL